MPDAGILKTVFMTVFVIIGLCCIASLIYGITSRRYTDKLVAVNIITTLSLNAICMLAVYLKEDYVLDIALIYALLSFTAVIVLTKLMSEKKRRDGK